MNNLISNRVCHYSNLKPKLFQVKIINSCNGKCWFCIDRGNYSPKCVDADKMIDAILLESDYLTDDIT